MGFVSFGNLLVQFWLPASHIVAWMAGFISYVMFARHAKYETLPAIKKMIVFALTVGYPFVICSTLKRYGVLAVDDATYHHHVTKILPFTTLFLGIISLILNETLVGFFKKHNVPMIGSLSFLFVFGILGMHAGSKEYNKIKELQRLADSQPTDANCLKRLTRPEQVTCLLELAAQYRTVSSCFVLEGLEKDPSTLFFEDHVNEPLPVRVAINRPLLEASIGNCFFITDDRLERPRVCEKAMREGKELIALSARCFDDKSMHTLIGKVPVSLTVSYLNTTREELGLYGHLLPSWKEVRDATKAPFVTDAVNGSLLTYVNNSQICHDTCGFEFKSLVENAPQPMPASVPVSDTTLAQVAAPASAPAPTMAVPPPNP
jgi:hypothetical protein